jgi:hypothetical protein
VLVFAKEGPVTIDVPVMPRAAQYATFAPPSSAVSPALAHYPHAAATPNSSGTATPKAAP